MNSATTQTLATLEDSVLLRLMALALERVQRRRQRPRKKGSLHRV